MLAQNVGISVQHNAFQERLAQLEDTIALTSAAPPCVLLPVLTPSWDTDYGAVEDDGKRESCFSHKFQPRSRNWETCVCEVYDACAA